MDNSKHAREAEPAPKPCDTCDTNVRQAIEYDEVTCYLTCPDFKKWQQKRGLRG